MGTYLMTEYLLPQGVPTAMSIPELRLLQRYAHAAGDVLEIGTQYGYSAIGMALTGANVTSVDPHNQSDNTAADTWERFLDHCQANGWLLTFPEGYEDARLCPGVETGGLIYAYRCPAEFRFNVQDPQRWGLVFIDADHFWPAPMRDARIALAHLRAPGYVAFHDVTSVWPGVWRAVRELTDSGELVLLEQERYLAVYQSRASSVSGRSTTPIVAE